MKKIESIAIIGYTGFVGSNIYFFLKKKNYLIKKYNSKNINKICNKKFDYIIFAGLPATKWKINLNPKKDKKNINQILRLLRTINSKKFILISTIDVHNNKESYGKNRLFFENSIVNIFKNTIILRLSALFGPGLKKNILFDLINNNEVEKINPQNKYQWLSIDDLNFEIYKTLINNQKIKNKIRELYTEPILTKNICSLFKNYDQSVFQDQKKRVIYNFKPVEGFYKNKTIVLKQIKKFIEKNET